MAFQGRPSRPNATPARLASIVVLAAAVGTTFEPTGCAAETAFDVPATLSLWDDEPIEELKPAPRARRASREYSWEEQHAKRDASGDLVWTPRPFVFAAGGSVRYVDFENGNDGDDGKTKNTAWKHHPWDGNAEGQAASSRGVHTYVFKRGVYYRSTLTAREPGQPGRPIRLTSDPSWGEREAVICGSVKITGGWKQGAAHEDIPDRGKVWFTDLDFAPRNVWQVEGEEVRRIPLARTLISTSDTRSRFAIMGRYRPRSGRSSAGSMTMARKLPRQILSPSTTKRASSSRLENTIGRG